MMGLEICGATKDNKCIRNTILPIQNLMFQNRKKSKVFYEENGIMEKGRI